jgi:hypothetical protein
MNIKKLNEQLSQLNEESLSLRDRLIAYAEHILDALLTLELHEFPSINETQEYEDIKYYASTIKSDLESGQDLDSES